MSKEERAITLDDLEDLLRAANLRRFGFNSLACEGLGFEGPHPDGDDACLFKFLQRVLEAVRKGGKLKSFPVQYCLAQLAISDFPYFEGQPNDGIQASFARMLETYFHLPPSDDHLPVVREVIRRLVQNGAAMPVWWPRTTSMTSEVTIVEGLVTATVNVWVNHSLPEFGHSMNPEHWLEWGQGMLSAFRPVNSAIQFDKLLDDGRICVRVPSLFRDEKGSPSESFFIKVDHGETAFENRVDFEHRPSVGDRERAGHLLPHDSRMRVFEGYLRAAKVFGQVGTTLLTFQCSASSRDSRHNVILRSLLPTWLECSTQLLARSPARLEHDAAVAGLSAHDPDE